jgi:hypothetical protein
MADPATISAAVLNTGSKVHGPGKGVLSVITNSEAPSPRAPKKPRN